jgi:hypothetical protein
MTQMSEVLVRMALLDVIDKKDPERLSMTFQPSRSPPLPRVERRQRCHHYRRYPSQTYTRATDVFIRFDRPELDGRHVAVTRYPSNAANRGTCRCHRKISGIGCCIDLHLIR